MSRYIEKSTSYEYKGCCKKLKRNSNDTVVNPDVKKKKTGFSNKCIISSVELNEGGYLTNYVKINHMLII